MSSNDEVDGQHPRSRVLRRSGRIAALRSTPRQVPHRQRGSAVVQIAHRTGLGHLQVHRPRSLVQL